MSKKSIFDVMGRAEAFSLMKKAVVAAAKRNRDAGVMTASHVNGQTTFSSPKVKTLAKAEKRSRSEVQRVKGKTGR